MTKENQEMLLLVVVCEFGLQFFFLFSFLVGPLIGVNPLMRPVGSDGGGSGPPKKTRLVNGPGPAHGSGLGMKKPGPNPTRCHS